MTTLYRTLQNIIDRLRSKDGTFDCEATFALGILAENVSISQHDWLRLLNDEVEIKFISCGEHKLTTIKVFRKHALLDDGGGEERGLLESKSIVEGIVSVSLSRDMAKVVLEKCRAEGAHVVIVS